MTEKEIFLERRGAS